MVEKLGYIIILLVAGKETTNLLSNSVVDFTEFKVGREESSYLRAVEEVLRYSPPA